MYRYQSRPPDSDARDEELVDSLIAVSVVAKRLAEKLRKQLANEEAKHGRLSQQTLRAGRTDGQD